MATVREYYEKDFNHSARIYIRVPINGELIEGAVLYDFAGFYAFVVLYVTGSDRKPDFFIDLLSQLECRRTETCTANMV